MKSLIPYAWILNILFCFVVTLSPACAEDDSTIVIGPRAKETKDANKPPVNLAISTADLRSPDLGKVREAANEIASTGNPAALPYLWALYSQGDGARRAIALQCIGRLGLPNQEENLFRAAVADSSLSIQRIAVQSIVKLNGAEKAAPFFIKTAADPKMPAIQRAHALTALGWLRSKNSAPVLRQWLKSSDSEMAVAAAEALGLLGDLAQVDTLLTELNTTSPELRPAVSDALERLTGKKFKFDLVKWTEWKKAQANPESRESAPPGESDTYKNPMTECPIDVAIVYDTTGSMLHVWPELFNAIDAVLDEWIKQTPSVRIGMVKYRSANPRKALSYSVEFTPLTRQYDQIKKHMRDTAFGGGSGGPQVGLGPTIANMHWRVDARKIVILIGDLSPQVDEVEDADTLPGSDATDEAVTRNCMYMIQEAWLLDGILVDTLYVRTVHGEAHRQAYKLLGLSGGGRFYEYDKAQRRLVEMSAEKVDPKKMELPAETALKWSTPRGK